MNHNAHNLNRFPVYILELLEYVEGETPGFRPDVRIVD